MNRCWTFFFRQLGGRGSKRGYFSILWCILVSFQHAALWFTASDDVFFSYRVNWTTSCATIPALTPCHRHTVFILTLKFETTSVILANISWFKVHNSSRRCTRCLLWLKCSFQDFNVSTVDHKFVSWNFCKDAWNSTYEFTKIKV